MIEGPGDSSSSSLKRSVFALAIFIFVVITLVAIMPSSDPIVGTPGNDSTSGGAPSTANKSEAKTNGATQAAHAPSATSAAAPSPSTKLSGAELKAQKKAEKAARRQQEIQARQVGSAAPAPINGGKPQPPQAQPQRAKGESSAGQHRRTGSIAGDQRHTVPKGLQALATVPEVRKREDKTVELFRHLYKTRANTIAGAGKEVHPAVLALGQQMSSYTICGKIGRAHV